MASNIYDGWCNLKVQTIAAGRQLHLVSEIPGARAKAQKRIINTVLSHYEDPAILADRVKRLGFKKAAKILDALQPKTKKARSGHVGEILATETVSAILPKFVVPISRLRWLDGRETAMRGEDVIAVLLAGKRPRFLKGESKSRISLSPGVVAAARKALRANKGRPSQHAMGFVMRQLRLLGQPDLALVFENYLLLETIQESDLVHLLFGLSGNDASAALEKDLKDYGGSIEQHSVNLRIADHPAFIASLYQP
ncbi:MAG TPA: hypothetical protein VHD61_11965 [Lacunisphaera sp.]|nr:hypothetical protein [Lacunisphaera sp.]